MRQWMVDPEILCDKHLRGEHVESHMFLGSIKSGTNIYNSKYVTTGLVETHNIISRHDVLADEMIKRGWKHNSPLISDIEIQIAGKVNIENSIEELKKRCPNCRERIMRNETNS